MKELYISPKGKELPKFTLNKVILNRIQAGCIETLVVEDARRIKSLGFYTIHPLGITIVIDREHRGDNVIKFMVEEPE